MASEFVIWRYRSVQGACIPDRLTGVKKKFLLHKGVPLRAGFPADAAFHMNRDFPNDVLIPDNVRNGALAVLVSARLHQFLHEHSGPCVEFLPVKIIDHDARVASDSHVIVHPIEPLACIDEEQSVFTASTLIQGNIDTFDKLVIDPTRVPPDRQLFKLAGHGQPIVVRRELAERTRNEGFSGLDWMSLEDYRGR